MLFSFGSPHDKVNLNSPPFDSCTPSIARGNFSSPTKCKYKWPSILKSSPWSFPFSDTSFDALTTHFRALSHELRNFLTVSGLNI